MDEILTRGNIFVPVEVSKIFIVNECDRYSLQLSRVSINIPIDQIVIESSNGYQFIKLRSNGNTIASTCVWGGVNIQWNDHYNYYAITEGRAG